MMKKKRRVLVQVSMVAVILLFSAVIASAATEKPTKPWMPGEPSDGYVHPSYDSIVLKWKSKEATEREKKCKAPNILGYRIYMREEGEKNFRLIKTLDLKRYPSLRNVYYCVYKVPNLDDYTTYEFRIRAYTNNEKGRVTEATLSNFKTVSAQTVRPMIYYVTAGGNTYAATQFRGGHFTTENGNAIAMARVSRAVPDFTMESNYSRLSAEYYVNDRGVGSETNNAVWVSTYTQHAYLFTRKNGRWKCVDDWEVSTGKAWSPTPSGNRRIANRLRSRHGIPWWNCFASFNAIHGRDEGWVLGRPTSGGCVRSPDEKAKKVYQQTWMHTRILIY